MQMTDSLMMFEEFRCGTWDVYIILMDYYVEIFEKLGDPSLTKEQREKYEQLGKDTYKNIKQQLQEIKKGIENGSLSYADFPIRTRKKSLEDYKKNDPEEHYDFNSTLERKNAMKRLLDYFEKEGFSI